MLEPLLNPDNVVAALLRPLTDAETDGIDQALRTVSGQLRARCRDVDERISLWGSTNPRRVDPDLVAGVLAEVVARKLNNPQGAASISTTEGPFSDTISFASYGKAVGSTGQLIVTQADVDAIFPPTGRATVGRTIRLRPAESYGYRSR